MRYSPYGSYSLVEELLRTIFEAFPEKSTITFSGKCSDCGGAVMIDIIPTSEGFGLLGGALVEYSMENFAPKCPDCYKANGKMAEQYKPNLDNSAILDKKDILNSILSTHNWMRK
jgi:hypothetical protein